MPLGSIAVHVRLRKHDCSATVYYDILSEQLSRIKEPTRRQRERKVNGKWFHSAMKITLEWHENAIDRRVVVSLVRMRRRHGVICLFWHALSANNVEQATLGACLLRAACHVIATRNRPECVSAPRSKNPARQGMTAVISLTWLSETSGHSRSWKTVYGMSGFLSTGNNAMQWLVYFIDIHFFNLSLLTLRVYSSLSAVWCNHEKSAILLAVLGRVFPFSLFKALVFWGKAYYIICMAYCPRPLALGLGGQSWHGALTASPGWIGSQDSSAIIDMS